MIAEVTDDQGSESAGSNMLKKPYWLVVGPISSAGTKRVGQLGFTTLRISDGAADGIGAGLLLRN